jgi:endonuclease/exonuclease/phosphatase family metal-dependent hydrolase
VKLVSYNVRYFSHALRGLASTRRSREAIAAALRTLAPQIICLQEASTPERFAAFARALGRPYRPRYFPVHVSRLYTTGLAILVDEEQLTVAGEGLLPLTGDGARGERRACAHLSLRDRDGAPLHVFNAHLSLPSRLKRFGHGENQLAQAKAIHALVHERAGGQPFVLCGDFNARPASPVHQTFAALSAPAHSAPTARLGPLRLRLDYLFGGNGVQWLDVDGVERFRGLSDHLPLIARFARR